MITVKLIRNEQDYLDSCAIIDANLSILSGPDKNVKILTPADSDKLQIIAILIQDWERSQASVESRNIDTTETDMNYMYSLVRGAARTSTVGTLTDRALKLNEEVGELSAEVLKLSGYKVSGLSKEEIRSRIIEEAVDAQVMIIDILENVEATDQEIINCAEDAVNKWLSYNNK